MYNEMQVVRLLSDASPDDCAQQLARVLASPEFAGSRQVQDFLSYVASAAFAQRSHLDQVEIARHVLNRGDDFNPIDDASVRKLGTLTRQRLERYYMGSGANDAVLIALPTRSYIPTFRNRSSDEAAEVSAEHPALDAAAIDAELPLAQVPTATDDTRKGRFFAAAALLVAGAAIGIAGVWFFTNLRHQTSGPDLPSFRLQTSYGDFMHNVDDISRGIIHVAPPVGAPDEVTVRMRFRPEMALHQAGILILDDTNHYVKLGRQFESRPQLEFGMETDGQYRKSPYTFSYDRYAQNGEPLWLSIRRAGTKFLGFTSTDGIDWRRVGEVLEPAKPLAKPRVALFASNGRTAAPPVEATFDHFTYGLSFHDRPDGVLDLAALPGWHTDSACRTPMIDGGWLSFPSQGESACRTALLHAVPQGDWTFSALVDCLPLDGNVAALVLRGKNSEARLIRWDISGAAVTLEHLRHGQSTLADFAGSPPLILRLECRNGVVRASFSRDDKEYFTLPRSFTMQEIGANAELGLQAGRSTWTKHESQPPRVSWIRFSILDLVPLR